MKRTLLKASLVAVLSATCFLTASPPVQAQVIAVGAGVWGWRNIVAPRFGGPFIAPDVRFRPFGLLDRDSYYGETPVAQNQADIFVRVPDENAQVWIQGTLMQQAGRNRMFESPVLEPGRSYTYEVRARWLDGKQTVDQTRTVPVRPGQVVNVDFSRPTGQ